MRDALSKLPTSAWTVSWAESHPSCRVLRAASVALVWVRSLPPGSLLSISVWSLPGSRKEGNLGLYKATLTPAALKLISKGGFPADNHSLHLQACYLINWGISQLVGSILISINNNTLNICLLSLSYNCFFAWTVLLSQINLPCLSLHEATSDKSFIPKTTIHVSAPKPSYFRKPKWKYKTRNQMSECLLSSCKEERKAENTGWQRSPDPNSNQWARKLGVEVHLNSRYSLHWTVLQQIFLHFPGQTG